MFDDFVDARTLESGIEFEFDLCIVGGGAAGITLAREFAGSGLRIALLEAGGLGIDAEVEALSTVESTGREYSVPDTRLRYFGGTTNHWGGHCVPYDPDDFEKKDWIPHSGWPITYDDIEPYYRRAHDVLELGPFDYDAESVSAEQGLPLIPFDDQSGIVTTVSRYNSFRFGPWYGEDLAREANISIFLYADASGFILDDAAGNVVRHVDVVTIAGNRFRITARRFVLASGGIENARLLLISNEQRADGLGNENDLVGRYFMEHLSYWEGKIVPADREWLYPHYVSQVYGSEIAYRFHLRLRPEVNAELQIPKFRSELGLSTEIRAQLGRILDGYIDPSDIADLLTDPIGIGRTVACPDDLPPDLFFMHNNTEQTPNPESRVRLGNDRDPAGRPYAVLDWRVSQSDYEGVIRAHRYIAEEIGRMGVGRLRFELDTSPGANFPGLLSGGAHHMGTTRMSDDPRTGVTDADCRIHTTENLYVAGSSVFVTGGYYNPTLTIVAMTIRLADHLKAEFAKEGFRI